MGQQVEGPPWGFATLTLVLRVDPVDGVKLGENGVLQLDLRHRHHPVDDVLNEDLLWHVGGRHHVEGGERGVDGRDDTLHCHLLPRLLVIGRLVLQTRVTKVSTVTRSSSKHTSPGCHQ